VIAAGALYSIGAPIFAHRIEADLERRVPDELAEAGFEGVIADFSGQDGTLHCVAPLSDPEAAGEVAYDVWGVRAITVDRSCRIGRRAPAGDDAADGSTTDDVTAGQPTISDVLAGDARLSYMAVLIGEAELGTQLADPDADPVTLLAPTDEAFESLPADVNAQLRTDPELLDRLLEHLLIAGRATSDSIDSRVTTLDGDALVVAGVGTAMSIGGASVLSADLTAANGVVHVIDAVLLPEDVDAVTTSAPGGSVLSDQPGEVAALVDAGVVTLTGVVGSEVERARLVDTATLAAGSGHVVDQLSVDPERALDQAVAQSLGELVAVVAVNLVSGTTGFDGESLFLMGIYSADANAHAINDVAAAVGITAEIERRPPATIEQAAELEAAVNEIVLATPLQFESGQAVLTPDAPAVLDAVAAKLIEVPGVAIVIEGHTDSDGEALANLTLSQRRAEAVLAALVERGVAGGSITAEGFGEQQPVLVGGVEDKPSSRRVAFRIEPAA
jgi:OOP family OmpA-OmpF porin